MENKKNNYPLLIIICVILISIVGILYFNEVDEEIVTKDETKYVLLDDYSRFYTIESIIYKYINLITSNSSDLVNVLDEEYVNSNDITKDNVYNFVNKLEGIYSFKAKKMYYEEKDKNFGKYYVYGYLIEEQINGSGEKQDYYLIVNLDIKNNLFSVTPYDGTIFREVNNG